VELEICPHKRILNQVFGVVQRACPVVQKRQQPRRAATDKLPEAFGAAPLSHTHKLLVGQSDKDITLAGNVQPYLSFL